MAWTQPMEVLPAAVQQCEMGTCWQMSLPVAARVPEAHGHGQGQLTLLGLVLSPAGTGAPVSCRCVCPSPAMPVIQYCHP